MHPTKQTHLRLEPSSFIYESEICNPLGKETQLPLANVLNTMIHPL